MTRKAFFYLLLCLCLGVGCKPTNAPTKQPLNLETTLDKGKCIFYGAYYQEEGIPYHVVDMDLLSPRLEYDSVGHIVGTGTNLYFSDIFISQQDTLLPATTYTADTTAAVHTFLPGMNYEGGISGAYLLNIVDSKIEEIILIEKGSFTLQYIGEEAHITFDLITPKGQRYQASFQGNLPYENIER